MTTKWAIQIKVSRGMWLTSFAAWFKTRKAARVAAVEMKLLLPNVGEVRVTKYPRKVPQ